MSDTTPSLEQLLLNAIEGRLVQVHTSMPGIVIRYDATLQQADVQPCLKKKYSTGEVVPLPVINHVPVVHPRAGNAMIHLPLKKGDTVQLVFAERSLDHWLDDGGIVDPEDSRKHNLSDAVAYPGGYSFNKALAVSDPTAITILNDKTEFQLKATGQISIKNLTTGDELFNILDQLLTAILNARVATSTGPQPLLNPQFSVLQSSIQKLKV